MTPTSPLFDRYVMVDWSSKSAPTPVKPKKDAIWVGVLGPGGVQHEKYCRTRHAATEFVQTALLTAVDNGERVLAGFDFAFGYPRGLADAMGREDGVSPWRATWDFLSREIRDDERNRNNKSEVAAAMNRRLSGAPGPFWACPSGQQVPGVLTSRRKGVFAFPYPSAEGLERLRPTERHMRGVQETWKLGGAGSVGGQVLTGIPRVHQLRFHPDLDSVSKVWPFEGGFTPSPSPGAGPGIVFAEIWPGIVDADALAGLEMAGLIRDQAQMRLMCEWARDLDTKGTLGKEFDTPSIPAADVDAAVAEEGWILGCPGAPGHDAP